jgi:hypothetical protein
MKRQMNSVSVVFVGGAHMVFAPTNMLSDIIKALCHINFPKASYAKPRACRRILKANACKLEWQEMILNQLTKIYPAVDRMA